VRVFKYKNFSRFAKKSGITDGDLKNVVSDLEKGLIYADLGGNVYKQQVARPGHSKARGFRTIVFFKKGDKTFFAYGFPKSERANIDDDELDAFKRDAEDDFSLTDDQLDTLVKRGVYQEVV
jgi:hypothetical protein